MQTKSKWTVLMRWMCLTLALLMLAISMASCKKNKGDDSTDTKAPSVDNNNSQETVPYEYQYQVPETYGGVEVTMLIRESSIRYHEEVENPQTTLEQAVFRRNAVVEEQLDVDFVFFEVPGFGGDREVYMSTVRNSVSSGKPYDIISGPYYGNALAQEGLLQNLVGISNIDIDKGWWLQSYNDAMRFNDKVYSVTGDLSVDTMACMVGIFYNKELYNNQFVDNPEWSDPYQMVKNGNWTFETMFDMTKAASKDMSGDGNITFDSNDIIGIAFDQHFAQAIPTMNGIHYIDNNNGTLSCNLYTGNPEKIIALVDMVNEKLTEATDCHMIASKDTIIPKFAAGQALFVGMNFERYTLFRAMEIEYGVLVTPKYSETDEYVTGSGGGTFFAITNNVNDSEMSGAVLDCLGYYSYTDIRPAFFESTLKNTVAQDPESYEMFDLIWNSLYIDFAMLYAANVELYSSSVYPCLQNGWGIEAWWAEYGESVRTQITKLTESLNKLIS